MVKTTDLNDKVLDPALGTMNLLNELRERYPRAISFAAGRPYEDFFRVRESLRRIERYSPLPEKAAKDPLDALAQYGATNGIIRAELAKMLALDEAIHVTPDSIIVTVGCQEAMMLCLLGLCSPERDVLLISDPAYMGVTGIARLLGIELCAVRSGATGLDLQDLRAKLASIRAKGKRARLLYDIPDFSNPTGYSMPLENRLELLALAEENDFLILEDQAYRVFSYDGQTPPSLKALDKKGNVIYLGTFAKTIFPGARIGFLVADQQVEETPEKSTPLTAHLSKIKSLLTVNTPPLTQALVAALLSAEGGSLQAYNRPQVEFYKKNRDHLLECLAEAFPSDENWTKGISWNHPQGGFFLTVTLPVPVDDDLLVLSAQEYGVLFVPMRHFYLESGGRSQLRLSFSYVSQDEIRDGVARLGKLIKDLLSNPRQLS
jgi:(S)-3,5-dihydroxyphenylglycine transaminase